MDDKLIPVSASPSVTKSFNVIISNIENYFRKYPPGHIVTPTPVHNTLKYNNAPVKPVPKTYDIQDNIRKYPTPQGVILPVRNTLADESPPVRPVLRTYNIQDIIGFIKGMQSDQDRINRQRLIYNVTKTNIIGKGEDFEILIKVLSSLQDHYSALILCLYCLKIPTKLGAVTLLGLTIEQCRHLGQEAFPIADTCMCILLQHTGWDTEIYSYCVAYLQAKARVLKPEAIANPPGNHSRTNGTAITEYIRLLAQAAELAADCKKSFCYDETGYFLSANVAIQQGNKEIAKKELRQVIFEMLPQGDADHPPKILKCPKCCILLLTLYDNEEDTKLIQEIADKSISIEGNHYLFYALYRQAEAMFAELPNCSELLQTDSSDAIFRLIKRYKMAENQIPSGYNHDIYADTIYPRLDYHSLIRQRITLLLDYMELFTSPTTFTLNNPKKEI